MADALVDGAALGAVFQQLLKAILKLGERAINFNPVLKDITFKVNAITPLVKEIDELNDVMDFPRSETEILGNLIVNANNLLLQCGDAQFGKLDYLKRPFYTEKLRELDDSIRSFMDILLLQMARDQKKNFKLVNQMMEIICRIDGNGGLLKKPVDLFVPSCLVPEIRDESIGLDKPVEELKVKVLKCGVQMLVVTAPGGCGKTTLALKFCHDKQVKEKFQKNIFFLTVSKTPHVKLILKNIIQSLRGIEVPDFQDDQYAFLYLEQCLRQTSRIPVLIVLDDVWEGSESENLLEKFFQMSNCKILLTSRFKFPRFGEPYDLEPLNHLDARELFRRSALSENRKPNFPDEEIVEKIVKGCKRFPLALKVVAKSLSGRALSVWKVTEREWSRSSILGSENELLECLKSSLDAVSDDKMIIKECFMDLGSFPEDQRIHVATFIDICAVLYDQDEYEAVYILDELSTRTLVNSIALRNETYDDDCHNESYFTQHDILRELSIHLTDKEEPISQRRRLLLDINRNSFPKWWSEKEMQPANACLLSITTDERFSSHWLELEAPKVEVLILNLRSRTYILPDFMKTMNKLKALIITNYGSFPTELTCDYELVDGLAKLERIRLERVSLPPLGNPNPKPLIDLHKVSFFMCKVGQAFTNCSLQISKILPNLHEISIDFCNDLMELPIGLCEIVNLEKLSITNCHGLSSLPEELGKMIHLKTLRLRSCIHVEELPESISRLRELVILDISHCLSLTKLPEKIGELQSLEKLNMWRCSSFLKPPTSLRNLKNLKVVVCDREIAKWLKIISPRLINVVKEYNEKINLDWL